MQCYFDYSMLWFRSLPRRAVATLVALVSLSPSLVFSQDSANESSNKVRIVPAPVEAAPFSPTGVRRDTVYRVELLNGEHLPQQDRLLVANSESSIAELARSSGLDYSDASWSNSKIACPSFANHLFLQFSRDSGRGDVSVFSASIPRNGMGKIRVIPILKRSYSLFSPAPVNAMTISAFNHIRAEEGQAANDDWLGNALCYAALAGARPEVRSADSWPTRESRIPALTATLNVQVGAGGKEVITFDDAAARPQAMEWTMTFTRAGKLIKASHKPAGVLRAHPVPNASATIRSWRVP